MRMDELRNEFRKYPQVGLPVDEIAAALQCFHSQVTHPVKPILTILARASGRIMITTGEMRGALAGGGMVYYLTLGDDGWELTDEGMWAS